MAPNAIVYGQQFSVGCDNSTAIASAVLMRCGSVTHQNNFSRRLVELVLSRTSSTSLGLTAPPNGRLLCGTAPGMARSRRVA